MFYLVFYNKKINKNEIIFAVYGVSTKTAKNTTR